MSGGWSAELIIVIFLALSFDFVNGFHDAANAIATCVSTRALSPRNAILMARTLNFIGALVHVQVAKTICENIINVQNQGQNQAMSIILVALIGAIGWDLITWYFGLPSSSTHALVGGLMGAGLVAIGYQSWVWKGISKVILAMIFSPLIGVVVGLLTVSLLYWIFRRSHPAKANRNFRWAQIASAAWMSLSHGMSDAQTSMGIITLALITANFISKDSGFYVPWYVKLGSALMMGLGTSAGGWRIIKTMGMRMVDLKPVDGFAAEFSSGAVIMANSFLGAPVSTTHIISCSIMGTGAAKNVTNIRWNIVRRIVGAWVFTIPGAAIISAGAWYARAFLVGLFN